MKDQREETWDVWTVYCMWPGSCVPSDSVGRGMWVWALSKGGDILMTCKPMTKTIVSLQCNEDRPHYSNCAVRKSLMTPEPSLASLFYENVRWAFVLFNPGMAPVCMAHLFNINTNDKAKQFIATSRLFVLLQGKTKNNAYMLPSSDSLSVWQFHWTSVCRYSHFHIALELMRRISTM